MKIVPMSAQLIDHMGSDLSVVNAARVSFGKCRDEFLMDGDPRIPPGEKSDERLVAYLAKHGHWSPFAHTSLQFRIKAPMFVARQLVKHQVGGVWNEVSRRYVDDEPEFFYPDQWRGKPVNAKQGSAGVVDLSPWSPIGAMMDALEAYEAMLEYGVAPEMARMVLPLNTMTEWIWTGSLYFFARVCGERMAPNAQQETGDIARMISPECEKTFPVSWAALREAA